MVQKKSYSRYFIILQEEEKGYAPSVDKMPSGYVKLEIKNDKCKVWFYIQSIKKESTPYLLVLICNKPDCKKIISLGEVNIEDSERNEYVFEYPLANIADTGISIEKICGAGVIKTIDKNIVSILSGFTCSEVPIWKGFQLIMKPKIEVKEEVKEEIKEEVKEEVKEEIKEEIKEEVNPKVKKGIRVEKEDNKFDKYEEMIEKIKNEDGLNREEETLNIPEDISVKVVEEQVREEQLEDNLLKEGQFKHNLKKEEQLKDNLLKEPVEEMFRKDKHPKDMAWDFFYNLVKDFDEVKGICCGIKNTKWFKIKADCLQGIDEVKDFNKCTMIYYPMMNYYPYIMHYGHFLIGYKYAKSGTLKYIIYGVPGRKNLYDQPYGGNTGFVTWVPLIPEEKGRDDMGYWLMFYDYKNSIIAIPLNR